MAVIAHKYTNEVKARKAQYSNVLKKKNLNSSVSEVFNL